jgi:hypothetical protein
MAKQVAELLGLNRGTVRSWLSRGAGSASSASSPPRPELEAMADQVVAGLAGVREALAAGSPHTLLAAAKALGPVVDGMLLADGAWCCPSWPPASPMTPGAASRSGEPGWLTARSTRPRRRNFSGPAARAVLVHWTLACEVFGYET